MNFTISEINENGFIAVTYNVELENESKLRQWILAHCDQSNTIQTYKTETKPTTEKKLEQILDEMLYAIEENQDYSNDEKGNYIDCIKEIRIRLDR